MFNIASRVFITATTYYKLINKLNKLYNYEEEFN